MLSSSWGWNPADAASDDPIFQEFAAQGQSYVSASGDDGAFNSSTYYFPSVDPYVIQVGGTDLTTTGPGGPGRRRPVGHTAAAAISAARRFPAWQQLAGVVNSSNQASTTLRNTPDVAAEANLDNPTVVNGSWSPAMAARVSPRHAGRVFSPWSISSRRRTAREPWDSSIPRL